MQFIVKDRYLRRKAKLDGKWHPWFAWYPVKVENERWCWLEYLERRLWFYTWIRGVRDIEYKHRRSE